MTSSAAPRPFIATANALDEHAGNRVTMQTPHTACKRPTNPLDDVANPYANGIANPYANGPQTLQTYRTANPPYPYKPSRAFSD